MFLRSPLPQDFLLTKPLRQTVILDHLFPDTP